ncbi:MAG: peptidylprolyl isomerase [Gammaproteobacteria bacterium]|jgi:peptidyl-prolyl cis-trans isomerase SurA|nr:peptidylprolyl isomerase [Gammaproteobacteria bacterium]
MTKILASSLFWIFLLSTGAHAATAPIDRVVAIVNDDVITRIELDEQMRTVKAQLRQQRIALPGDEVLRRQVLERMALEHIQLQIARQVNIVVDDDALNQAINGIAAQNGLSLTEFRSVLQDEGYDFTLFRENIRKEMTLVRLRQQNVDSRVNITDQEIENFLAIQRRQGRSNDEYRLGHILLALPDGATPEQITEVRARAETALQRLRAGDDFSEVAIAVSDGQQALDGGDLGWRRANEIPTLFADLVPQMRVGDTSELIRSSSGFHIIRLAEHRTAERHIIDQTRTRHILISADALTDDAQARRLTEELRERILAGADFAELAREHSDDRGSGARGGDLGWVEPGMMVPAFEQAMDALDPGEVSEPVQSEFGWHLVQVLERRSHDATEDFTRDMARESIFRRKAEEEFAEWLRRLREEAYVEFRS